MSVPEFIDNRDGDTLAAALAKILAGTGGSGFSEGSGVKPADLSIASAFLRDLSA